MGFAAAKAMTQKGCCGFCLAVDEPGTRYRQVRVLNWLPGTCLP